MENITAHPFGTSQNCAGSILMAYIWMGFALQLTRVHLKAKTAKYQKSSTF